MFTIAKQFTFSASHQLEGLPPAHPCARLHGHNYVVEVILHEPTTDARGFVVDYGDLAPIGRWLDENFDHRHLNDVVAGSPTAELLAAFLFRRFLPSFPSLVAVRVSETPKTWAEFRP